MADASVLAAANRVLNVASPIAASQTGATARPRSPSGTRPSNTPAATATTAITTGGPGSGRGGQPDEPADRDRELQDRARAAEEAVELGGREIAGDDHAATSDGAVAGDPADIELDDP